MDHSEPTAKKDITVKVESSILRYLNVIKTFLLKFPSNIELRHSHSAE